MRGCEYNELNAEFKLRVLDGHYRNAYEGGLSDDDDLYIELLNDPKKLDQVLKDECIDIQSCWADYRHYGYL